MDSHISSFQISTSFTSPPFRERNSWLYRSEFRCQAHFENWETLFVRVT